ncbi:uncharacterized protein LOC116344196 isoform X2 [Contarinia nasturtii]|uniref:uncharacterized protein LOC116344196 isoform X2 n=1 Tax=Contarinia nasturtii TaxID=265458 RepID=UPI0012D3BBCB|nr:uncharacterized protein LOC116344196 isoform X2 [Contarinia nasturtii]
MMENISTKIIEVPNIGKLNENNGIKLSVTIKSNDPKEKNMCELQFVQTPIDDRSIKFLLMVKKIDQLIAVIPSSKFEFKNIVWLITVFKNKSDRLGIRLECDDEYEFNYQMKMSCKLDSSLIPLETEKIKQLGSSTAMETEFSLAWDYLINPDCGYVKEDFTIAIELTIEFINSTNIKVKKVKNKYPETGNVEYDSFESMSIDDNEAIDPDCVNTSTPKTNDRQTLRSNSRRNNLTLTPIKEQAEQPGKRSKMSKDETAGEKDDGASIGNESKSCASVTANRSAIVNNAKRGRPVDEGMDIILISDDEDKENTI